MWQMLMALMGRVTIEGNKFHGPTVLKYSPRYYKCVRRLDEKGRVFLDVVKKDDGEVMCSVKENDTDHTIYNLERYRTGVSHGISSITTVHPHGVNGLYTEMLMASVLMLAPFAWLWTESVAVVQKAPFTRIG